MSYQITYPQTKKLRRLEKQRSWRLSLTALCFFIFLILTHLCWPEGREYLKNLLIPGDPAVTVSAMEAFSQELKAGGSLSESFAGFCRIVLEEAGLAAY